jgi:hypothetical protein
MRRILHRSPGALIPVLCLALWIESAAGQAPPIESRAQKVSSEGMNGLMFGVHYGVPLKWSAVLAAPLPVGGENGKAFVAAEPGIGGWRASMGYATITSQLGSGYVARATLLRTNNKAWRAAPRSTFAGPEFQFMPLFAVGARIGGFVRIGGRGPRRGLLTADISLML